MKYDGGAGRAISHRGWTVFVDIANVFWRDWVVLRRRFASFVLARMVAPVLYLVAFGWGLGRSLPVGQGSYLDYIVPGILALNSMNISFNSVGTPLNMSRLYHKTLEEYLVAPVSPWAFVIGKLLAGTVRGLLSSLIIVLLALAFGAQFTFSLAYLLVITLNCLVFSALGFAAAMLIDSHEDMGNFGTYVLLPMSFLCATFFSPDKLPGVVRLVLDLLPLTHVSYALRAIGNGGDPALVSWLIIIIYLAGFTVLSFWSLQARRD